MREGIDISTLPPEVMRLRTAIVAMQISTRELARQLEVDSRLVRRWATGEARIPKVAVYAVEHMLALRRITLTDA